MTFLLSQTLMAQQRAEEEEREAQEVKELEADLASKEQQLLGEVEAQDFADPLLSGLASRGCCCLPIPCQAGLRA